MKSRLLVVSVNLSVLLSTAVPAAPSQPCSTDLSHPLRDIIGKNVRFENPAFPKSVLAVNLNGNFFDLRSKVDTASNAVDKVSALAHLYIFSHHLCRSQTAAISEEISESIKTLNPNEQAALVNEHIPRLISLHSAYALHFTLPNFLFAFQRHLSVNGGSLNFLMVALDQWNAIFARTALAAAIGDLEFLRSAARESLRDPSYGRMAMVFARLRDGREFLEDADKYVEKFFFLKRIAPRILREIFFTIDSVSREEQVGLTLRLTKVDLFDETAVNETLQAVKAALTGACTNDEEEALVKDEFQVIEDALKGDVSL